MPTTRPNGHSTRSMRTAAVLFTATLTLVTACANEEPVDATQTPTTSTPQETETSPVATPAATPVETASEDADIVSPPVLPDAAKENTEEGAIAFTEHFLATVEFAIINLDSKALESLSSTECKYCASLSDTVREIRENHGWIEGYELVIERIEHHSEKDRSRSVLINYTTSAHEIFDGKTLTKYEPRNYEAGAILMWEKSRWILAELGTPS